MRSSYAPRKVWIGASRKKGMRGLSRDLKQQIVARLEGVPDRVWTPVDFLDLAPRAAVDKALQRMAADGAVRRLDRGLYLPQQSRLIGGLITPDVVSVIEAVGRRDQARLLMDPLTAAIELRLTDATAGDVTILSDARLRSLQVGPLLVRFKQAAPSRLFWAGRPGMRVVQALHWSQSIAEAERAARVRPGILAALTNSERGVAIREDLREGLPTLPTWMQGVLRELLDEADPRLPLPLPRPARRTTRGQVGPGCVKSAATNPATLSSTGRPTA